MKRFFIVVKKIFYIILSFLFGIFYKKEEVNFNHSNQRKENQEEAEKSKNIKEYPSNQEEQPSNNRKENQDYYLKKDLEKLYYIIQKIEQIEYQLKIQIDETYLKTVRKEIEIVKQEVNFLDKRYRKVEKKQKDIKSLTVQLDTCKRLIGSIEKRIEKLITSKKMPEQKEISVSNIETKKKEKPPGQKNIESKITRTQVREKEKSGSKINKDCLASEKEEEDKKEKSNKVIQEESNTIGIENSSKDYLEINDNILEDIIIKDIEEDIIDIENKSHNNEEKENKREEIHPIQGNIEKGTKHPILKESRKNKPMTIRQVQDSSVKKYPVNLSLLKQRISILRTHSKLRVISSSIKKALKCTLLIGMGLTIKNQPYQFIGQQLMTNNYIRKARKTNKKNVKPLKHKKVSKLGTNIVSQTSYIMVDTLKQIQLLRNELYSQYELTDEIKKILDDLNEIELEIKMNLEQTVQKDEEKEKFR